MRIFRDIDNGGCVAFSVCSMYYSACSRQPDAEGLMSDDKSSDEFFMKIREKGKKKGRMSSSSFSR